MNLSGQQIDQVYKNLKDQLQLKIMGEYDTMTAFSKKHNIPRTTLSKIFSDNIDQDMSIGMYMRILTALDLIPPGCADHRNMHTLVTLKDYLAINNNLIMNTITIITNDL